MALENRGDMPMIRARRTLVSRVAGVVIVLVVLSFPIAAHMATIVTLWIRLARRWARSCALSLFGGSA